MKDIRIYTATTDYNADYKTRDNNTKCKYPYLALTKDDNSVHFGNPRRHCVLWGKSISPNFKIVAGTSNGATTPIFEDNGDGTYTWYVINADRSNRNLYNLSFWLTYDYWGNYTGDTSNAPTVEGYFKKDKNGNFILTKFYSDSACTTEITGEDGKKYKNLASSSTNDRDRLYCWDTTQFYLIYTSRGKKAVTEIHLPEDVTVSCNGIYVSEMPNLKVLDINNEGFSVSGGMYDGIYQDAYEVLDISKWTFTNCSGLRAMACNNGALKLLKMPDDFSMPKCTNISKFVAWDTNLVRIKGMKATDFSSCTNFQEMFCDTHSLKYIDFKIDNWVTTKASNIYGMFSKMSYNTGINYILLDKDIIGDFMTWKTDNVKLIGAIFNGGKANELNLSGWNLSNVRCINNMFSYSAYNTLNLSNWTFPRTKVSGDTTGSAITDAYYNNTDGKFYQAKETIDNKDVYSNEITPVAGSYYRNLGTKENIAPYETQNILYYYDGNAYKEVLMNYSEMFGYSTIGTIVLKGCTDDFISFIKDRLADSHTENNSIKVPLLSKMKPLLVTDAGTYECTYDLTEGTATWILKS